MLRGADAGLIPYVSTRPDREHLPDEALRVPQCRRPGRGHRVALGGRSRRRRGHRGSESVISALETAIAVESRTQTRAQSRSRRATPGRAGWPKSTRCLSAVTEPAHHRDDTAAGQRHRAAHLRGRGRARSAGPAQVAYVEFGGSEPAPQYDAMDAVTLSGGARVPRSAAGRGVRAGARARRADRSGAGCVARADPDRRRGLAGSDADHRRWTRGAAALLGVARRRTDGLPRPQPRISRLSRPAGSGALRSFERSVLSSYAECWMPTRADAEGAVALAPRARTRYVPNVVDVDAIGPMSPGDTPRLLLVATSPTRPTARRSRS